MNSCGQMELSEGQCYNPGVFWGHLASSAGGAGSGLASSKRTRVTVIAAPAEDQSHQLLVDF